MVWDEEVRTLAMMASRMLKGSMVYTTKMIKRKKDTYRGKESRRVRKIPVFPYYLNRQKTTSSLEEQRHKLTAYRDELSLAYWVKHLPWKCEDSRLSPGNHANLAVVVTQFYTETGSGHWKTPRSLQAN